MKPIAELLRFRDQPISRKLVIVTMVTVAAALLLAAAGIVWADSVLFREYLQRDLITLAEIVADDSMAALEFDDADAARQTLEALRARPRLEAACTYRINGAVFAEFTRDGGFRCPPPAPAGTIGFGKSELAISQPIRLKGTQIGSLMLFYSLGEIPERMRLYGSTVLGVFLVASLLAFLLSSRLRSVVTEPVTQLVDATTSVSETGDYSIRARKLSGDELGYLVDRFNEMLAGIQSRDNELKKALAGREAALRDVAKEQERFHFMAESMPQKIFAAGPGGENIYLNQQWMEYTGLTLEQLQHWGWMQFIHPDDLEDSLRIWKASTDTGEPIQLTNRFRRHDGVYRWHLSRGRAMRGEAGEIILWIGSCTDIHEQKEREEELRRANEDLQQFAYSASHDLQEPIRNVAVYSEIVARRYQNVLDDDGKLYLTFLKEGGRRLATLVNDLLDTRARAAPN
jgi:PAS domain S-box-containing protein